MHENEKHGWLGIRVVDLVFLHNSRGEEVVDFGWGKKRKKVITVGDETDSLELALYEQLIEKVEVVMYFLASPFFG
jgi:hypothetical protein